MVVATVPIILKSNQQSSSDFRSVATYRQKLTQAPMGTRAILKDAPIVILDEATGNVDTENESRLQEAIAKMTKNKTIIMIAHRLKTVRNAHQILVLDKGKIVHWGNHEQLMAEGGLYADFIGMRAAAVG